MDIQYYREFLALVETKNFWEASERLYIGESSLSKHISRMENELGEKLFDRSSRRVALTRYGKILIPYAEQIVRAEADCREAFVSEKEMEHGVVQVGMLPSAAQYRITDLYVRFHEAHPENLIRVVEDDSIMLKQSLRDRQCEIAFLREPTAEPVNDSDLEKLPFVTDYMVALFPRSHPLAQEPSVTLSQLQEEKFILLQQNTSIYDQCLQSCLRAGYRPHVIFSCHRLDTILDLVTQGMGISLLMNRHIRVPERAGLAHHAPAFAAVPVEPAVKSTIYIAYRKKAELSETAESFLECARQFIREMEEDAEGEKKQEMQD